MICRINNAQAAALVASLWLRLTSAQQPGNVTAEVHPQLTTSKCTTDGGCVAQNTSVVLDFGYRWLHTADYASCTTPTGINSTLCPDEATCAQNCVVEGANYTAAGVATSGSSMTMSQYVPSSSGVSNASPRVYLLDNESQDYVMLRLLGQELTFDVDVSALPCGENGALYLSEMDASGGRNPLQTGGASYGSGYCDAQCPVQAFRNGTLNAGSAGYCCDEMDVLESNSAAAAFTPHPCADDGSGCDRGGCGFNPYALGYRDYWAPGGTLDTGRPFTVTTQFVTDDGTAAGTLREIRRVYRQDGRTVPSAAPAGGGGGGGGGGDAINATWCAAADGAADGFGNLAAMGAALGRGMVLAFSIWNDAGQFMDWLDEGANGPCSSTAGDPSLIEQNSPDTHVVFSSIRWGDIGSTTAKAWKQLAASMSATVDE